MSIAERMKKYAEVVHLEAFSNSARDMFIDLQTAMRALEVAREAIKTYRTSVYYDERGSLQYGTVDIYIAQNIADQALKTINELLGEK